MPKIEQQQIDPLVLGGVLGGNPAPQVQEMLLEYLKTMSEVAKEQKRKLDAEEESLRQKLLEVQKRQANMAQIAENARLENEKFQERCLHVSENGASLVQGQRLGKGAVSLRCQSCGKQYKSFGELPPNLRPKSYVGGVTSY